MSLSQKRSRGKRSASTGFPGLPALSAASPSRSPLPRTPAAIGGRNKMALTRSHSVGSSGASPQSPPGGIAITAATPGPIDGNVASYLLQTMPHHLSQVFATQSLPVPPPLSPPPQHSQVSVEATKCIRNAEKLHRMWIELRGTVDGLYKATYHSAAVFDFLPNPTVFVLDSLMSVVDATSRIGDLFRATLALVPKSKQDTAAGRLADKLRDWFGEHCDAAAGALKHALKILEGLVTAFHNVRRLVQLSNSSKDPAKRPRTDVIDQLLQENDAVLSHQVQHALFGFRFDAIEQRTPHHNALETPSLPILCRVLEGRIGRIGAADDVCDTVVTILVACLTDASDDVLTAAKDCLVSKNIFDALIFRQHAPLTAPEQPDTRPDGDDREVIANLKSSMVALDASCAKSVALFGCLVKSRPVFMNPQSRPELKRTTQRLAYLLPPYSYLFQKIVTPRGPDVGPKEISTWAAGTGACSRTTREVLSLLVALLSTHAYEMEDFLGDVVADWSDTAITPLSSTARVHVSSARSSAKSPRTPTQSKTARGLGGPRCRPLSASPLVLAAIQFVQHAVDKASLAIVPRFDKLQPPAFPSHLDPGAKPQRSSDGWVLRVPRQTHKALVEHLSKARADLAKAAGSSSTVQAVLHDEALQELAVRLPATDAELRCLAGLRDGQFTAAKSLMKTAWKFVQQHCKVTGEFAHSRQPELQRNDAAAVTGGPKSSLSERPPLFVFEDASAPITSEGSGGAVPPCGMRQSSMMPSLSAGMHHNEVAHLSEDFLGSGGFMDGLAGTCYTIDLALMFLALVDQCGPEQVQQIALRCGRQSALLSSLRVILRTPAPSASIETAGLWRRLQLRCREWLRHTFLLEDPDNE